METGLKEAAQDRIPVKNVFISVSDVTGLDFLVRQLIDICPEVKFMSTGRNRGVIDRILGAGDEHRLMQATTPTYFIRPADIFDMAVVTLYPFQKVIAADGVTFEKAIENISIVDYTMIRAAAKNFPSCAVVCDPADYNAALSEIRAHNGCTSFDGRFIFAKKVFALTAGYDAAISGFFEGADPAEVRKCYQFAEDAGAGAGD